MPSRMTRRYWPVNSAMSAGVRRASRRASSQIQPAAAQRVQAGTRRMRKADKMRGSVSYSFLPYFWAAKMDRPRVKPVMDMVNRLLTAVVMPTAARASSPTTWPTI